MNKITFYSIKSIPYLLRDMKGRMVRIGTSLDAKKSSADIKSLCGAKAAIVVLGNEEHGISSEVKQNCDHLVIIPFSGMEAGSGEPKVDSLNVAQAASIIMYEMRK